MSEWAIGTKLVHESGLDHEWGGRDSNEDDWISNGWRPAVPALPVERALAAGWMKYTPRLNYVKCWTCGRRDAVYSRDSEGKARTCAACAMDAGVFASPEPKAEAAKQRCKPGCGGPILDKNLYRDGWRTGYYTEIDYCSHECRERSRDGEPVPQPAPVVEEPRPLTCSQNGCGDTDRVQVRYVFKRSPKPMCQACYLECERGIAEAENAVDDPKPRPGTHPGVTPVVFGVGVGVWASRGM